MADLVTLPLEGPFWERTFSVFPLVIVGTREAAGGHDLAPKHMAMPLSWGPWFGFVCTPRHATWQNVLRTQAFTVSYPRPGQELITSLSASPRCEDDSKPALAALPVRPATVVDGVLVDGCGLYLECRLDRIVDGLGDNGLIIGRVVAAHVHPDMLRDPDVDDAELIYRAGVMAYLHPFRFAEVHESQRFPVPEGFSR